MFLLLQNYIYSKPPPKEIELQSEDEAFDKPEWFTTEVTFDKRYTNVNLAKVDHAPCNP